MGSGNFYFADGQGTSEQKAIIRAYDGLLIDRTLGVVNASQATVADNQLTIEAAPDAQWFSGSSLRVVYANGSDAVSNNVLTITGGKYTFTYDHGITAAVVFMSSSSANEAVVNDNQVVISDATVTGSIRAAETTAAHTISNNTIRIDSGTFSRYNTSTANTGIYAAFTERSADGAVAEGNTVTINGGTFTDEEIAAANTEAEVIAQNNVVEINGGTFLSPQSRSSIYGVKSSNTIGSVDGSGVIINGGAFEGDVDIYAVYDTAQDSTDDVFIEINAKPDMNLQNVALQGSVTSSTGRVTVRNPSGLVLGSIMKINVLELEGVAWDPSKPAVRIESDAQFKTVALSSSNGFTLAEGSQIRRGDAMTLVQNEYAAWSSSLSLPENSNSVYTQANVARAVSGHMTLSEDQTNIQFVVDDVESSKEAVLIGEHRSASVAFLNEGADAALLSLEINGAEPGFTTFAAATGASSSYDAADDLDIDGWHFAAGTHGTMLDGNLSAAVYFETGTGNYRTDNEFNAVPFRGDGELTYRGGGLAARWRFAGNAYVEGSLRAGEMHADMPDAVRAADGELYGYDSRTLYWGGHLGAGKLFETETASMDLYARWYWTRVNGDSFTIAGDDFDVDDVTSQRLRIGAKVRSSTTGLYLGTAFEHEFDGDAPMTAAGLDVPLESIKGSTFMGEAGWRWRATSLPVTVDANVSGWTGERTGVSGRLFCSYAF